MSYLDMANNLRGVLTGEARERLIAVLANPTQETWDDAYALIIDQENFLTLWRAVLAVDPSFPGSKKDGPWERVPDYDTLWRAVQYAVSTAKPMEES